MEEDNIESSSVTRRNFITGLSGLGAISLNTGGVSAKQLENKAQYDIGLPLEKQWSFGFTDSQDMGSPTIAPGTITDDTLYVSLQATDYDPAKIVAVDRDSHEQIWEITADADISEPVVADDTLYVTSRSTVQAYSATEKSRSTLWTQNTQFDYIFWPTLVDDSVCFSGYNVEEVETSRGSEYHYRTGGISLYAKDGSRKWTHTGEYMHSPSIYEDSLIHLQGEQYKIDDSYQVESGKIVSRSKKTGKVQWTTSDLKAYSIRPTQNYVLAHTRGDAIRAIDPNSGNIVLV